jgi:hypothetical protein
MIFLTLKKLLSMFKLLNLSSLPSSNPGSGRPWLHGSGSVVVGTFSGSGSLTVREVDGNPTGIATEIVFPNGTVSFAAGVATITGLQGPQGNTGPTGATGATGATGPAGPNSIGLTTDTALNGFLLGNGSTVVVAQFGTIAGSVCQGNDARLSDARTPTSHAHGNITFTGAIGSTSGLPVLTTAGGVLTTGTLTGTGTVLVASTSPTLVTPNIGVATGTRVTLSAGTATTSTPIQTLSQTWNAGAVTFIGLDVNITDTASANGSKMIDFRSGGTSRISIKKAASAANHTAPFRLNFADAASMAWSPEWGAITVRNDANNADSNLRVFVLQAVRGVEAGDYFSAGGVEIASTGWRGAGRAITLINNVGIHWSSTTAIAGTPDLSLTRNAANIAQLGDGGNNALGSLLLANLTASGWIDGALRPFTVAGLPLASASNGKECRVTDSTLAMTSANYGSTPSGGGSNNVRLFSNGTAWLLA